MLIHFKQKSTTSFYICTQGNMFSCFSEFFLYIYFFYFTEEENGSWEKIGHKLVEIVRKYANDLANDRCLLCSIIIHIIRINLQQTG